MRPLCVAILMAVGLQAGCGGAAAPKAGAGSTAPLTVADWKVLPVDQKYTLDTLERLKQGDPSLQTAEGWEAFQKTVVMPARKKDFPAGKSR